jgi:predicted O-methyltransferase YrrM
LRHGDVFDPNQTDEATLSIRTFNRRAAEDDRLLATIYPGGDGILMAVKLHD